MVLKDCKLFMMSKIATQLFEINGWFDIHPDTMIHPFSKVHGGKMRSNQTFLFA